MFVDDWKNVPDVREQWENEEEQVEYTLHLGTARRIHLTLGDSQKNFPYNGGQWENAHGFGGQQTKYVE